MFRQKSWRPVFAQVDLKQVIFKIKDGTTVPNEITITVGEGNLTWSEKKNIEYKLDRGTLDSVRLGDQAPVEVSFDIRWDFIMGSTATGALPTPYEALTNSGTAASWASADTADPCNPYAVDLEFVHTPACTLTGTLNDVETITFTDFRYESIDFDFSSGQISVSGKANIEAPTVVRNG